MIEAIRATSSTPPAARAMPRQGFGISWRVLHSPQIGSGPSILCHPAPPVHLGGGGRAVDLAIRIPDAPTRVCCRTCHRGFQASGPTGYQDAEPLCDACLFECDPGLGMVLALVAVARGFGGLAAAANPADDVASALELLGFARAFERVAATYGPARAPFLTGPLATVDVPETSDDGRSS